MIQNLLYSASQVEYYVTVNFNMSLPAALVY